MKIEGLPVLYCPAAPDSALRIGLDAAQRPFFYYGDQPKPAPEPEPTKRAIRRVTGGRES